LNDAIVSIDDIYNDLAPGFPMRYDFLDDSLRKLYEKEQIQARIFSVFSLISILLACLGIFGLAMYAFQQRQKELGIRKILGATVTQIIRLISNEFVILVLIATIIAIPLIWYFMSDWLGNFAYRIKLLEYWYAFVIGGGITILIAVLTVAFKTYNAAILNPTESIRNE